MALEKLKSGVIKRHVKPSDKVSPTLPIKVWLEASSISSLNKNYKAIANKLNSDVNKMSGSIDRCILKPKLSSTIY